MLTKVSKKGWDLLSSTHLTIFLLGVGGLYYLALLIALGAEAVTLTPGITLWGRGEIDISQLVASTIYGKLFFALLILNLAARLAKGFLVERYRHLFWSKFLFKAGLLIFLTGLILSMSTRTVGEVYLGEGQTINLPSPVLSPSRYSWIPEKAREISSGQLPWSYLRAERVDPGLSENFQPKSKSLVFSHLVKALISFSPNLKRTIGIHPPRYINGYYLFLTRFGFGPGIWIMDNQGRDIYMGFQVLEIFPPGAEDTFRVPGLPYTFYLSLAPLLESQRNQSVNLRHPVYRLRVMEGKKKVYQGVVWPEQEVEFDNKKIIFPETRFWVKLAILKDRGLLLVFAGLFLTFLSFVLILIFGLLIRKEEVFPS